MVRTIDKGLLTPSSSAWAFGSAGGVTGNFPLSALARGVGGWYNVKDPAYGAAGDGTTDDTAAIQAAIDAAASAVSGLGGEVTALAILPPGDYRAHGLALNGQVGLIGVGARLTANASGSLLTVNGNYNRISGIAFQGGGSGVGANGVVFGSTARWSDLSFCRFDQFSGRAIYTDPASVAIWIEKVLAQNCLLTTAGLADYTGVMEIDGTDHWATGCEITASRAAISSASLYADAIVIKGANHMFDGCVGEISDIGIYIASGANSLKMSNCRADLNLGYGWLIDGGSGSLIGCEGLTNSQASDRGYDNWLLNAGNFQLVGCRAATNSGSLRPNYGFRDMQNSFQNVNTYVGCRSTGAVVNFFNVAFAGAAMSPFDNPAEQMTAASTTWNVDGKRNFFFNSTGAVTFTSFSTGRSGQRITVKGDGFTTIQHNATIKNTSGADILSDANKVYSYLNVNGVWYQD